jgi:hypothetical protein
VAGRPPAWMVGPVEEFENLSPEVPGYQWAGQEQRACTCGQSLAEGHIL